MTSVVALTPGQAWAVGYKGEMGDDPFMRWDGRAWKPVRPPVGLRNPRVVSGTSADNVWVFDDDADAWRWDGRRWSAGGRPPWPRSTVLRDAVVAGPEAVWVAGSQNIGTSNSPSYRHVLARWSPAGWSEVRSPRSSEAGINRFGAVAPDDLWAVAGGFEDGSAVEHWDGQRWRTIPLPLSLHGAKIDFRDIAGVSAQEIWVVGSVLRPGRRQAALLMRWDGGRWNLVNVPAGANSFGSVASDGHGGVLIGASNYHYDDRRILLRFDGRSWTYEEAPRGNKAPAVFDLARVPGDDQVFAVGGNPSYDEDSRGWIWTRR